MTLLDFLDQLAALQTFLACEYSPNWSLQPLIRHTDPITVLVAYPAHKDWIWLWGLPVRASISPSSSIKGISPGISFRCLLFEELVDGFHLREDSVSILLL